MAYATVDEVRNMDPLDKDPNYTDAMISDGIAWAKARIDEETGTSWEFESRTVVVDGSGGAQVSLGVVGVQTITSATVDGAPVADVSSWVARPGGVIWRGDSLTFPTGVSNVEIVVTAGMAAAAPADIAYAARLLARRYVLDELSNPVQREIEMAEFGPAAVGAYGGRGRPTPDPAVNAVLRRRDHKLLAVG